VSESRRILVVGAGAIGGLYAACLAKAADVVALDTNREHGLQVMALAKVPVRPRCHLCLR
jgi:ketopantoate reductase